MEEFLPPLTWTNLLIIPGVLIGFTIHELGHAMMAYMLGDASQAKRGKLTLNPLEHVSWFGGLFFVIFGVGWPKTFEVDSTEFKRPHFDMFLVAAAGPCASFLLCIGSLFGISLLAVMVSSWSGATIEQVFTYLFPFPQSLPEDFNLHALSLAFTGYISFASLWMTIISLLPLPGQDGLIAMIHLIATFRQDDRADSTAKQEKETSTAVPTPRDVDDPILLDVQQQRRNKIAEIHFKAGTEYHNDQKYEDAIARYRQAIATDQHFGPAYVNLGLAHLARGNEKQAVHAFRGAIQYADDEQSEAEAWYQLHLLTQGEKILLPNEDAPPQTEPWQHVEVQPDWFGLALQSTFVLVLGALLYSYLIFQLVIILSEGA